MNNRRTLFALVGLFIVLLVISVLQSNRVTAPGNGSATLSAGDFALKNPNRIFKDFEAADIQAFGLLDPDTSLHFTLARDGDNWSSIEFGNDGLDNQTADTMALTVSILPYLQTLPDVKPDSYAQFGLTEDKAYLLISVLLKDKTEHAVIIGDVLPDKSGHYALVDDRNEVYAIDARAVAFLVSYLRQVYLPPTTATPAATATSAQ